MTETSCQEWNEAVQRRINVCCSFRETVKSVAKIRLVKAAG
jgi:hypothetical protein